MKALTEYNREKFIDLQTELNESRLKKAARLITQEPPGTLLDVGCGNGAFAAKFLSIGFTVHGVDLTPEQVEIAIRNGISARVFDVSFGPLPYGENTFDILFAGEVIEHIVDTTFFIKDIFRVLKPGGCAVLTTPNLSSFENRLRLLFGIYPIWLEYKLEGGQGHVRAYTPRAIKRQLQENGFIIEKHVGNWVPFIPQKFIDDVRFPAIAITGDWFPNLSMDIIIKARKPR